MNDDTAFVLPKVPDCDASAQLVCGDNVPMTICAVKDPGWIGQQRGGADLASLLAEEEALLREVHPDVVIGTWQTGELAVAMVAAFLTRSVGLKSAFDFAYRRLIEQPSTPPRRGCVIN